MKNLFFMGLVFLFLSCQAEPDKPVVEQTTLDAPCAETAKKIEQELSATASTKAFDLTGESTDAGCTITKD